MIQNFVNCFKKGDEVQCKAEICKLLKNNQVLHDTKFDKLLKRMEMQPCRNLWSDKSKRKCVDGAKHGELLKK